MNIMEYIQRYVPIEKAWPGMRNNPPAQVSLLNRMEMEIREGIAQELEQLVIASAEPKPHGMASPPDLGSAFFLVQQDFFRAAANVVRGKEHTTEEDWATQADRMKGMAELKALREQSREIFPMPSDAELQRKFDDQQDRLREWNE